MGEPEGKKPLGRHRLRWEDNIKMDLQEVGRLKMSGDISLLRLYGFMPCTGETLSGKGCIFRLKVRPDLHIMVFWSVTWCSLVE